MDAVQLVIQMCKDSKIPISKLERDLGFSNGYIKKLKNGKIPVDRLKDICDYLNIDIGSILEIKRKTYDNGYYMDEETIREAQEMFMDPDMKSLYHMKQTMDPKRFKTYMDLIKAQYKLEHQEE